MKKYLRYADGAVLLGGSLGILLRLWLLSSMDEKGLYPKYHISTILLAVFSLAMLCAIWFVTRKAGDHAGYRANFPRSIFRAAGSAAAAIGFAVTSISGFGGKEDILSTVSAVIGLLSAGALLLAAWQQFQGKQTPFVCHLMPCVYFSVQLFLLGRQLGNEPEIIRHLYLFLATIAMVPACYQLWGFDVGEGNRPKCLFWSLIAAYLCLVSVPGNEKGLVYLCCGLWLLTNLPTLKYLPKRKKPAQTEPQSSAEPEVPEETAEPEAPVAEAPEVPISEPVPQPKDEADPDPEKILEDLLKEIDRNIS